MTTPAEPAPRAVTISLSDDEHVVLLDALVVLIDDLVENKRPTEIAMALYQRIGAIEAAPAATTGQDAGVTITDEPMDALDLGQLRAELKRDGWTRSVSQLMKTEFWSRGNNQIRFEQYGPVLNGAPVTHPEVVETIRTIWWAAGIDVTAAVPSRADQPDAASTSGQPEGRITEPAFTVRGTVSEEMIQAGANVVLADSINYFTAHDLRRSIELVGEILEASLAHVPPTDSLEQAIAECEAEFDDWEVGHLQRRWDFVSPHDASVYIEVELPCSAKVVSVGHGEWGHGATPAEALRNAMARSREREDIKRHRQVSRTFALSDPGYAAHVETVEKELAARLAERQAERDARGNDEYDDEE